MTLSKENVEEIVREIETIDELIAVLAGLDAEHVDKGGYWSVKCTEEKEKAS